VSKRVRRGFILAVAAIATTAIGLSAPTAASASTTPRVATADVQAQALPPYSTWVADVTVVADSAKAYLSTRLPDPTEKTAIVLDIDNTSLETTYSPGVTSPANKPVLEVAKQAKAAGAAVFFVTARPELIWLVTQYNLRNVGYPVDGLYMRPSFDFEPDQSLKTKARTEIEGLGYTIVANIGNRDTDLAGGHAERTFKLPDYDNQLS
jgi:hypothetical protein